MDIGKLERNINSLRHHAEMGNKYLKEDNYYSAIEEFNKVVGSLPEAIDIAKKESVPPLIIALYLQLVNQTLISRQICYLSIGEREKAHEDEKMFNTINNLITKINMQSKAVAEKKKEETSVGGFISNILSVIFIILMIYSWFR